LFSAVLQDELTGCYEEAGMGDGVRYIRAGEAAARLAFAAAAGRDGAGGEPGGGRRLAGRAARHDPATVYLAVGARLADPAKTVPETERAL